VFFRNRFYFLADILDTDISEVKKYKSVLVIYNGKVIYDFYGSWDFDADSLEKI